MSFNLPRILLTLATIGAVVLAAFFAYEVFVLGL